jgi:mono/diheme cytochrome c family protein
MLLPHTPTKKLTYLEMLMKFLYNKKFLTILLLASLTFTLVFFTSSERQVDYSADVKPILNKRCITCHGGVKAKAGFSVLFREDALAKTESGKYAIVPGDPGASEMIRRIKHNDPEERMPYKHEKLSDEEISILTRWIKQGAKWGDHWAYVPVKKEDLPEDESNGWAKKAADRFIFEKLQQLELSPSTEADKATLLRRVSLDIIGRYPEKHIADKFLSSTDPKAFDVLVDSLLASKHFGEKWATMWLDLSRYADSKGYEADGGRQIWRYRDWVIDAFNEDKPYDLFITEQIAGDLLPEPTDAQYIATGFSRNSMTNDEGGTDNEEFRTSAVIDRVNTTWEALMGTTFSCVQCHSHPYDPFRHEEYYSFLAYFNNTRDEDQYPNEYPYLRKYDANQEAQLEKIVSWVKQKGGEEDAEHARLLLKTWQPAIYASTADSISNGYISGNNGSLFLHSRSSFRLKKVDLTNADRLIIYYYTAKNGGRLTAHLDSPDGKVIGSFNFTAGKTMQLQEFPVSGGNKVHDIYFKFSNTTVSGKQANDVINLEWLSFGKDLPGKGDPGYAETKAAFTKLLTGKVETVPVIVENPAGMRRPTKVFERGNRLTLGKEVQPGVPGSLSFAIPKEAPQDRRGLAMWLTSKQNPLVSRTIVNRIWEQLMGTGIVETLEDMGTQGIAPTHKELLDHYAWKLMNEYKWSLKTLIREFVTSATYRQDSRMNEELKEKDPYNRYYARGPRLRLHAEQLRDQHLCISGVMSNKMHGPSVMPWQPEGVWNNPYNSEEWINSKGEDQYRRAVYTYIKRSGTYPSLVTFDGTSRNVCSARRIRTNTPLQALVTLNDSVYIDLATHFADRMISEGGNDPRAQVEKGYEIMLYRKISPAKADVLVNLYNTSLESFEQSDSATLAFTGAKKANEQQRHRAAMKVVANAMLNLDEVITKN